MYLGIPFNDEDIRRFYSKIEKNDVTLCWNWTGEKATTNFTGIFRKGNKSVVARRLSFTMNKWPLKQRDIIHNTCGNNSCVNPEHLFVDKIYDETGEIIKKYCFACKQEIEIEGFQRSARQRVQSYCRECRNSHSRKKYDPEKTKIRHLRRQYGMTIEEHKLLLNSQNNECKICNKKLQRPNVDHCHSSGKVRGILCADCNHLLGNAHDSIDVLKSAIDYLICYQE